MTSITILHEAEVTIMSSWGTDAGIADAARVSLDGQPDRSRDAGLINTLLAKRHGSPFEHTFLKFHIKAPIMVFREFQRHRIGFSYNEMSGRYMKLPAEFYIPPADRPLFNEGTSMSPKFVIAGEATHHWMSRGIAIQYQAAWDAYEAMLEHGIANEVARAVLPVGIMSQMVVSCNARSLMSFLSLRVDSDQATFPTKPQWEIDHQVARMMEYEFKELFPLTHLAFVNNGRVAP